MLNKYQKKHLRSLLHARNIIIWIGQNGLTENVLSEIETALDHHELIKIRVRTGNPEDRDKLSNLICQKTGAEFIQGTGGVICLFRANPEKPVIIFPK